MGACSLYLTPNHLACTSPALLSGKYNYKNYKITILDVRKIGHLNIKTKMLDIEARALIGWYSLASQSERVPTRCFYVKLAYLSYGEYITINHPYSDNCSKYDSYFQNSSFYSTCHVVFLSDSFSIYLFPHIFSISLYTLSPPSIYTTFHPFYHSLSLSLIFFLSLFLSPSPPPSLSLSPDEGTHQQGFHVSDHVVQHHVIL